MDRYVAFGLGCILFGVPFAAFSYWILLNTALTALGLAVVVLGATVLLVPSSPVPKQTIRAMVEGSCINVEALLEEFDVRSKAVYLPPRDGRVVAYASLSEAASDEALANAVKAPLRILTEYRGERGLMLWPPGSEIVRLSLLEEAGVEDALVLVLVDTLEAVDGVKAVDAGDRVVVELSRPKASTDQPRFKRVLGSLPVSVAGCVVAAVLKAPVQLVSEDASGSTVTAVYRRVRVG